jgi:hypothetical protein
MDKTKYIKANSVAFSGRRLDAYNSSTHAVIRVNLLIVGIKVNMVV